jgi:hypothetical protein
LFLLLLLLLLLQLFLYFCMQAVPLLLGHAAELDSISGHAQRQAFLQAAVLASVTASAVDGAVLLAGAGVGHVTLLAPAKEALAPLTGDNPVVDPRRLVPTDFARDHFNL